MKKIISLYQRNYDGDRLVRDEVVPGAEWVLAGEGRATRKFDGTSCLIVSGKIFRRYDAKKGKTPPPGFIATMPFPDPVTGHWPGWIECKRGNPDDQWHFQAFDLRALANDAAISDGTYELVGPKIQGNKESEREHRLIKHGSVSIFLDASQLNFKDLRFFLEHAAPMEGIVWHHPDGRMAKVKRRDFGLPW